MINILHFLPLQLNLYYYKVLYLTNLFEQFGSQCDLLGIIQTAGSLNSHTALQEFCCSSNKLFFHPRK